jgi:predicted TIM-barrel fold metal-dependent hydrolase
MINDESSAESGGALLWLDYAGNSAPVPGFPSGRFAAGTGEASHKCTILVQAAPTYEESDYLLSLEEGEPSILGVVGWLDLADPEHKWHYRRHRAHPKYKGFRIKIQDMPDVRAILEPSFIRSFRIIGLEPVRHGFDI